MNNTIIKTINDLDETKFQDFCNSMLFELFGAGIRIGGTGKDRGRDSLYEGELRIPNTPNPPTGKWCFQCKFHNLQKYSPKQKSKLIITDLTKEYKKFTKMNNLEYDSYFFMTNAELTWADGGTLDKVDKKIKPLFYKIGFKNILIYDGIQIQGIFAHIPNTIRKYLGIIDPNDINLPLMIPKTAKENYVVNLITKELSRNFESNLNPNPHIHYLISWKYTNLIFYLISISSFNALQSVIEMIDLLSSNEIICINGEQELLERLKGKVEYLPIPATISEKEILDRLLNFKEYMI